MVDFNSELCTWILGVEAIRNSFVRYALPYATDFAEAAIPNDGRGGFSMCVEKTAQSLETIKRATAPDLYTPTVIHGSALRQEWRDTFDVICTDPPYYDAIPYSDIIDFFHVWLRRSTFGLSPEMDEVFRRDLGPKWDHEVADGELIDQVSRFSGDRDASRRNYENGMAEVFKRCHQVLKPHGRLVVVFANKQPTAWETLVAALIRGGFVVDGTWPIQTEQAARMQAVAGAALASSVWLVCNKRSAAARAGWDNKVLEEMRANIATQLREFWDAGIRGPDFVWAATGPALEAYSKHPVVKKANDPGKTMEVSEFLSHVRRMVVDFVVGRVLTGDDDGADLAAADRMDAPTAYYLLHRHDFGFDEAPSGACILYATACGLSDSELESTWDVLIRTGSSSDIGDQDGEDEEADPDAEANPDSASDSGSKVKLKTWVQRKHKSMGYEAPGGQPVPLIDRIHRLMHLWRAGDVLKVDEYLDDHGLRRYELFRRLLQSLIELSPSGCEERTLLESLSNHFQASGTRRDYSQISAKFREEV